MKVGKMESSNLDVSCPTKKLPGKRFKCGAPKQYDNNILTSLSQSKSMQGQSDLLCLRHARSEFNKSQMEFFERNPHLKYPEAEENLELRQKLLFSQRYIDPELCSEGLMQCEKLRADQALDKVKLVLVSPFNRTLMTAKIIFGHRPAHIMVHPLLAQPFRYSSDVIYPMKQKMRKFRQFDFSEMRGIKENWYIEKNLGPKNQEIFNKSMGVLSGLPMHEQQKHICSLIDKGVLYETNQELKQRTDKLKRVLNNYRERYDTIAVISHQYILSYLITQKFDNNHFPAVLPKISNAVPYWFKLAKLLPK